MLDLGLVLGRRKVLIEEAWLTMLLRTIVGNFSLVVRRVYVFLVNLFLVVEAVMRLFAHWLLFLGRKWLEDVVLGIAWIVARSRHLLLLLQN